MIFLVFISACFALSLLLASTAFIIWSLRKEGPGVVFAKIIGIVIFILSLLSLIVIFGYKIKYWRHGYFETPMAMSMIAPKRDMAQMRERMIQRLEEIKKMREKNPRQGTLPQKAPPS